jgi:hypothetical protein
MLIFVEPYALEREFSIVQFFVNIPKFFIGLVNVSFVSDTVPIRIAKGGTQFKHILVREVTTDNRAMALLL